jgi:uncharacterized membrane protein YccC
MIWLLLLILLIVYVFAAIGIHHHGDRADKRWKRILICIFGPAVLVVWALLSFAHDGLVIAYRSVRP